MKHEADRGLFGVVTTIQSPNPAMQLLMERIGQRGGRLVVVGDAKSPSGYDLPGAEFYSLQQQQGMEFELCRQLPIGHYARKNLGYLLAVKAGASTIYETDDDNAPAPNWELRQETLKASDAPGKTWLNAYQHFSSALIWPRGFPLDELRALTAADEAGASSLREVAAPIQQGLANGSPDVDAVWRLVLDRHFEFEARPSISLPKGSWCPFNSQSTWWWPSAWPLMYLPSHCSFRMTDIWRSFIAQRCLWELGHGLVFHAPEVIQERNEHDLMRDFADEVVGYLRNKEFVDILSDLKLQPGAGNQGENMRKCYEALVARQFFPETELSLVDAWLSDLRGLGCA